MCTDAISQEKIKLRCDEHVPKLCPCIAHYYWKSTSLRFLTHFILNKASQHVNCRWSLVALLIWNRIQTLLYELPGGLALAGVIQVKDIKHFKANVYGLDRFNPQAQYTPGTGGPSVQGVIYTFSTSIFWKKSMEVHGWFFDHAPNFNTFKSVTWDHYW